MLSGCVDGESVSEYDGLGRSCVMYAVHYSQLDTLQILMEHGADVNLQSRGMSASSTHTTVRTRI